MHKTRIKEVAEFLIPPAVVEEGEPIVLVMDCFLKKPERRVIFVVDTAEKFIGTIKLSDFVLHLWPYAADTEEVLTPEILNIVKATTAGELASYSNFYLKLDSTLEEAVTLMRGNYLDALPVLDEEGKIIGEVNYYNVLKAYIRKKMAEETL